MLQATFSTEATTQADRAALCRALALPPPAPDEDFTTHLEAHGYTAERCWYALSKTTDLHVMIACAALRGVNRLPPDPRLNPKPLPPAQSPANGPPASADPQTATRVPGQPRRTPPDKNRTAPAKPAWRYDDAVLVHVVPNPKRIGSATYERFKGYVVGRTVREILAAGVTRGDINWDGPRGFVTFERKDLTDEQG